MYHSFCPIVSEKKNTKPDKTSVLPYKQAIKDDESHRGYHKVLLVR